MESATVIARGAGTTTIVRSDELAARVLQDGIKKSRTADPKAVVQAPLPDPRERRSRRPDKPREGLDALRAGVGRVGATLHWCHGLASEFEASSGYVCVVGDEGPEVAFVSHVLAQLQADPNTFDLPDNAAEAEIGERPVEAEVVQISGEMQIDLAPQRYLSLIRWSDADDEVRVERSEAGLSLTFSGKDQLLLENPDFAGSIVLHLGPKQVVLKEDPAPRTPGLIDVVL